MKTDRNLNQTGLADQSDRISHSAISEILRSLRAVRFGSVEITIHDSRIVQIERKEKVRFSAPSRLPPE